MNRVSSILLGWLHSGVAWLAGAHRQTRTAIAQPDLVRRRSADDEQARTEILAGLRGLLERTKAEYDRYAGGGRNGPPEINILIISGGGDWGAFGAGVLKGWRKVLAQHPMAMPEFDAVTGVSTGTLIAPFAFLGDQESIDRVVEFYRTPQNDLVKQRGVLFFLPDHISFSEVPGLERQIRKHVTADLIRRIAAAGADGRILKVNTTNLDQAAPRVFDLLAEARRASETGQLERIHDIMLASSGIPGVFPFRMIDEGLYVDGAVTGNIVYGGWGGEGNTLPALWQKTYPNLPIPKIRMWVIFNNQFRPLPVVTGPNWPAVITRSLETATRTATATAVRHLFAMVEIARLKRQADVEAHVIAIPGVWSPPVPGLFSKESMNDLADLGEKMGADPASWSQEPPTI
jgi:Patatin-like phospholipase